MSLFVQTCFGAMALVCFGSSHADNLVKRSLICCLDGSRGVGIAFLLILLTVIEGIGKDQKRTARSRDDLRISTAPDVDRHTE